MVIRQGDLIWVQLPLSRGSEPSGRRPALVLQSNALNLSRISTVIIAVITSNLKYETFPGNIRLLRGESGIPKSSVINLSQIRTLDREFIESKIGSLSAERQRDVQDGLKLVFNIQDL